MRNIFGSPYIDLFGRDKLLACPAHLVTEWADKAVYMQLSDDINAISQDFSEFNEIRQTAISQLGTEFFYTPGAEPGGKIVPGFF